MNADMTDGIYSAIESYTGHRPMSCPWRALFDLFVHRVIKAHRFFESGNLHVAFPSASHKLMAGVGFYDSMLNAIHSRQLRSDREKRDMERASRG